MGDLQRKTSLADKVLSRQKIQRETVHEENHTIDRVVPAAKRKNKAISARVYGSTYNQFRRICDAKGITANACLNMLIADFVRENKAAIE